MARDSGDIIKYGLEMIAVAFRLAHELTTRAKRIEKAPGCWAYTILGVNPTRMGEILDDFHTSEVRQGVTDHCTVKLTSSEYTYPQALLSGCRRKHLDHPLRTTLHLRLVMEAFVSTGRSAQIETGLRSTRPFCPPTTVKYGEDSWAVCFAG